jgi:hypothetical protein
MTMTWKGAIAFLVRPWSGERTGDKGRPGPQTTCRHENDLARVGEPGYGSRERGKA